MSKAPVPCHSYSLRNFTDNKLSGDQLNEANHEVENRDLAKKRARYVARLDRFDVVNASCFSEDGKRIRRLQRNIWLITGILDHHIDTSLLNKIAEKYRLIDAVPSSYYLPELFQKKLENK